MGGYASTDFLWDGMRLSQETHHDRQGEEALTYLYESNSYMPLARIDQDKATANDANGRDAVYYFHNDVSGLSEELTSADGELIWQARYKVWGNAVQEEWIAREPQQPTPKWGDVQAMAPVPANVPRAKNLRFQGQYLDRETGLHYNTFRFYDPDIGRFISPDPTGLMGGTNLYHYARNPISWIDPFGLSPCSTKSTPESFEGWVARSRGKADVYLRSAEGQEPNCVRIAKDPSTRYAKNRDYGLDLLTDETGQLPRNQARSVEQAVIDAKRGEFANIDNSIHPNRPLYNAAVAWG